ncbi:MAG: malonic semialdehyde reductase [Variovorax sp.]
MNTPLPDQTLAHLFTEARTFSTFLDRPVSDDVLHRLYETAKWGPTSMNCQPARWVFVRSEAEKARLVQVVAPGNQDKVRAAPVTLIVAYDKLFHQKLASQFPVNPAAAQMFESNADLARDTALRNSSLQGAYLILAARALGLDAGPMSGFNPAALNEAFFPDGQWQANFLVNLGWGDAASLRPRLPRLASDEVVKIL